MNQLGERLDIRVFQRQEEALEYCASSGADFRVFSREVASGGTRVLHVFPSCLHFWKEYKHYQDIYKTFNEVIPIDVPAKLYFDLEFPKDLNRECHGPHMVDTLLAEVNDALIRDFPESPIFTNNVIKLNASYDTKFSQHVIFPNIVFQNLAHVKVFVSRLCSHITERIKAESSDETARLRGMLVNTGRETALFVDQSVYGKKQNLRVFQSRKFGKAHPFVRADGELTGHSDKDVFLKSLITNTSAASSQILVYPADIPEFQSPCTHKPYKNNLLCGSCPSPFPELDAFFGNLICANGMESRISRWTYEVEPQTLVLFVEGDYRACERTGEQHEQYGVFFVVELKTRMYRVRCLSPDCGKYRSPKKPLPENFSIPSQTEGKNYIAAVLNSRKA